MAESKIKTLAQDLAEFQKDLPTVDLDAENPHFKSKFATLANVTKKVVPKLAEHGFSFTVGSFVDNGLLVIDAHLLHVSGESRSLQFPITETNPQKVGSAISYARRYALTALTGVVADTDDDGNAASIPSPTEQKIAKAKARPTAAPQSNAQAKIREDWIDKGLVSRDDVNSLVQKVKKEGATGAAVFDKVLAALEAGELA